jgi:hypothetical protein
LTEKKQKLAGFKGAYRVIVANILQFQLVQIENTMVQILPLNDRYFYNLLKSHTCPEENLAPALRRMRW